MPSTRRKSCLNSTADAQRLLYFIHQNKWEGRKFVERKFFINIYEKGVGEDQDQWSEGG